MFDTHLTTYADSHFDNPRQTSHASLLNQALNQFNQARWRALLERIISSLLRRQSALLHLESLSAKQVRAQHHAGLQTVSLERICGSLGRTGDFDHCFHPLSDRLRDRWVGIALARRQNLPLEPVELIQVGGRYFVQDGHHRISVARARGETAIEAEITLWEVSGPLPWEAQLATEFLPQTI